MLARFALVLAFATAFAGLASAAERPRCLPQGERQVAVGSHRFVPLARVIAQVKARYGGHILRVRLCKQANRYLYVLTVLPRNGKVVRAAVDATSGAEAGGT